MVRSELVQSLRDKNPGLSVREVESIASVFFDGITSHLTAGGRVELRGFGVFFTRPHDGGSRRNPRTGESFDIASRRLPRFKSGKEMKDRLTLRSSTQHQGLAASRLAGFDERTRTGGAATMDSRFDR
jgi:integration host factor subunit beta